ncbi:MAG: hemerythrin domain-containing protein [Candidatus Manganitrophaceae bacterium]|nr:MAG: hemerythrin domain-containing protein [Candidatus Manganitrophaceae bacterium]
MKGKKKTKGSGDPTHLLKREHRATLLKLELMERALLYLRRPPEETTPAQIEIEKNLLKELAVALDKEIGPHFRKEEEALFPVLAEYIGREYGPIEVMLREHEKICAAFLYWKKIVPSFSRSTALIDDAVRKALLDPGLRLVTLLRQHIEKENQILFEISEAFLTGEEKKEVIRRIRAISASLSRRSRNAAERRRRSGP